MVIIQPDTGLRCEECVESTTKDDSVGGDSSGAAASYNAGEL